jgi:hypothetical protein
MLSMALISPFTLANTDGLVAAGKFFGFVEAWKIGLRCKLDKHQRSAVSRQENQLRLLAVRAKTQMTADPQQWMTRVYRV